MPDSAFSSIVYDTREWPSRRGGVRSCGRCQWQLTVCCNASTASAVTLAVLLRCWPFALATFKKRANCAQRSDTMPALFVITLFPCYFFKWDKPEIDPQNSPHARDRRFPGCTPEIGAYRNVHPKSGSARCPKPEIGATSNGRPRSVVYALHWPEITAVLR